MSDEMTVEYRSLSILALVRGDTFTFDEEINRETRWWMCATAPAITEINVYCDETKTTTTVVPIPKGQSNCLLEVVLVEIPMACTLVIDVRRWSGRYSVARTPEEVAADAQEYFDPMWLPPDLYGIVHVK